MASQSAKKIAKVATKYKSVYLCILIASLTFHFILKGLYNPDVLFGRTGIGFLVISAIYAFTYSNIRSCLNVGVGYSMYQDVYILNTLVSVLSVFSKYSWYIFISIPLYLIYKIARLIVNWVFTPEPEIQLPKKLKNSKKN